MSEQRTYHNPVQRGFFPDPSVIRVGDDYYMVNSSFQYFPAIPISHSRDMVHWHIIGHAITNPEWLDISDIRDSHGIWAPDIEYVDGKYYIYVTLRLNADGTGRYEPISRFVGEDSFAVTVTDGAGQSKTVAVTITITH